ncbi:hypothetical protein SAMN05216188_1447 [Lentzea xinjiangensis]|uniref:Uncharacterized protein n=1 Tax=Lentzea xinjiangensis TaxID=402600 RepID=A0A1H9WU92_9PSEU|nr:hypothetical protein [Lentzea xinjiangensis]SES37508.1 hypothetical protein SAMN05216188_1447 [Lentzea xinjiangensis]
MLFNTDECLAAARERLRYEVREELEEVAEQYAELENKRNDLIRRIKAFGDSDRYVASRARLSHTAVQNITKQVRA